MSRAALSGWYQLPVQGLAGCHLAGKSGSTGAADAVPIVTDEMWPHHNYSYKKRKKSWDLFSGYKL